MPATGFQLHPRGDEYSALRRISCGLTSVVSLGSFRVHKAGDMHLVQGCPYADRPLIHQTLQGSQHMHLNTTVQSWAAVA